MQENNTDQVKTEQTPANIEKGESKQVVLTPYQAQLKHQWDRSPNRMGERAPIYLNDKGEPIWLNRKQRRTQDKLLRIKAKREGKKAA